MLRCLLWWLALLSSRATNTPQCSSPSLEPAASDSEDAFLLQVPQSARVSARFAESEAGKAGPLGDEASADESSGDEIRDVVRRVAAAGASTDGARSSGGSEGTSYPEAAGDEDSDGSSAEKAHLDDAASDDLDAEAARIAAAAEAISSGGGKIQRVESADDVPGGSDVLRAAADAVKRLTDKVDEDPNATMSPQSEAGLRAASEEIERLIREARSQDTSSQSSIETASEGTDDSLQSDPVADSGPSDSESGADMDAEFRSISRRVEQLAGNDATYGATSQSSGQRAPPSIESPTTFAPSADSGREHLQSTRMSMVPWLELERNLTSLAQLQNGIIDNASSRLDEASLAFNKTAAARDRRMLEYMDVVSRTTEMKQNLTVLKDQLSAAVQLKDDRCGGVAAEATELEKLEQTYNKSENMYAKLAGKVNAEALLLNMSLSTYAELKSNTSDVRAAAVDAVRAAETRNHNLQEEIKALNKMNEELMAEEKRLEGSVSSTEASDATSKLDNVHAQASVVANATDNLTRSKIAEHRALVAAGDVAAKIADASQEADTYRRKYAEDKASLTELHDRQDTVREALRVAEADVASARRACTDSENKVQDLATSMQKLQSELNASIAQEAKVMQVLREANASTDKAWSLLLRRQDALSSANNRMRALREALLKVEAKLASLDDKAAATDGSQQAKGASQETAVESANEAKKELPQAPKFEAPAPETTSQVQEVWQSSGEAALMRGESHKDRAPGDALPSLLGLLICGCLFALIVVACVAKPSRGR
eukprot:TRINITY_DN17642_c1_g4_i1.p1 TRINITY_DN17642_c1_g4~~TRINITY_DN17642_c1_g4_i1.p1  ORF type:complete len:777 (-),score=175.74 TRINITY_DN17642_c1_g4_i1:78-2408(-)